ncbi:MAG: serine protease, partial [Agathobacter sp.]|nr:serine protease [Agathobacter sp.]
MQTESQSETEETQSTENAIAFPTDLSLSISDYQTLQDELYKIGNEVNTSIVTVAAFSTEDADWSVNPFEVEGQSSGLVVSEDDNYIYVLTEKKVIADGSHIRISFVDNTGADATLLKYDANSGIAILTVEKRLLSSTTEAGIEVATLGSSYEMANGAIVIALGSPLGTNYSILTGNITSVQNEIATQDKNYSVFTTDIVASENASGVLVNTKGEVVGIVMQSFSGSQDINTLTAVEVDELKDIIDILKNGKDVPYIGLYMSTVTEDISKDYDIPVGVYIKDVASNSPAMHAGLQSGDVIVKINGTTVKTDASYSDTIGSFIPGTTCEITVKRQSGNSYYDVTYEVEIDVLK